MSTATAKPIPIGCNEGPGCPGCQIAECPHPIRARRIIESDRVCSLEAQRLEQINSQRRARAARYQTERLADQMARAAEIGAEIGSAQVQIGNQRVTFRADHSGPYRWDSLPLPIRRAQLTAGNNKIGHMWNLSLPPVITCPDSASCAGACYACSAWQMRPTALYRWACNLWAFSADPDRAAADLAAQITAGPARLQGLCRGLVSGDLALPSWAGALSRAAALSPGTLWYAYTKTTDLPGYAEQFAGAPENLQVLHSQWPGRPVTGAALQRLSARPIRRAWIVGDDRAPADMLICPATFPDAAAAAAHRAAVDAGTAAPITCDRCQACPRGRRDIGFHLHS